jgi:hypothetical protein
MCVRRFGWKWLLFFQFFFQATTTTTLLSHYYNNVLYLIRTNLITQPNKLQIMQVAEEAKSGTSEAHHPDHFYINVVLLNKDEAVKGFSQINDRAI